MEERTTELRREPPLPPPWYREHWWIWLVALLLIVAGIIAFFALRGDGDEKDAARQRVTVPNVVGQREQSARATLQERGFEVEVVRQSSDQPGGIVVEQDPAAGSRLAPGTRVSIAVSTGPQPTQTVTQTTTTATTATTAPETTETTEMPDLVGTEYPDAVEELVDAGLFPDSFPVDSAEERGNVVDQRPSAGTEVVPGSDVRLDVAIGSGEREEREVPDLTGQSLGEALQACAEAGFTCRVTGDGRDVADQQPAAGGSAPELSQIALATG